MGCGSKAKEEKPGANEIETVRQAEEKIAYFERDFAPLQENWINDTERLNTESQQDLSVARAVNSARTSNPMPMAPTNMTPDAGNFKKTMVNAEANTGTAMANAGMAGQAINDEQYQQQLQQIVGAGRQVSNMADANLSRSASFEAGRQAQDVQNSNMLSNQRMTNLGSLVGTAGGAYAYSKWGSGKTPDAGVQQ